MYKNKNLRKKTPPCSWRKWMFSSRCFCAFYLIKTCMCLYAFFFFFKWWHRITGETLYEKFRFLTWIRTWWCSHTTRKHGGQSKNQLACTQTQTGQFVVRLWSSQPGRLVLQGDQPSRCLGWRCLPGHGTFSAKTRTAQGTPTRLVH